MWPFKRKTPQLYRSPRPSPRAPQAIAALRRVPGPSPWYLEGDHTAVQSERGRLQWRSAGDAPPLAGKTVLATVDGKVLAITDFQCYVLPLSRSRMLVWHAEENREGSTFSRKMRFRILGIDDLRPIQDIPAACAQLGKQARFYAEAGEIASIALSTALADG